jgi:alpha-galactosidase
MKKFPDWLEQSAVFTGEQLMKLGLQLPVMDPETAMLIKVSHQT